MFEANLILLTCRLLPRLYLTQIGTVSHKTAKMAQGLKHGDRVRLVGGSYNGRTGTFQRVVGVGLMARVALDDDTVDHRRLTLRFIERLNPDSLAENRTRLPAQRRRRGNNQPSIQALLDEALDIKHENSLLQLRMEQLCIHIEELLD
jgi:hypothetical protein